MASIPLSTEQGEESIYGLLMLNKGATLDVSVVLRTPGEYMRRLAGCEIAVPAMLEVLRGGSATAGEMRFWFEASVDSVDIRVPIGAEHEVLRCGGDKIESRLYELGIDPEAYRGR